MPFRTYQISDKAACLELFRSNVPKFFAPHEEAEFSDFLGDPGMTEDYFVLEDEGKIVGCGGVFVKDTVGGLSWGMVANDKHRKGYGKQLLLERLEYLREHFPHVKEVRLDTSQHTFTFFGKFGFVTRDIIENGYAEGLHRYEMVCNLER